MQSCAKKEPDSGLQPLSLIHIYLGWISSSSARSLPEKERSAPFVPAGQSTQMIIGATKENDYQLLSTSQLLYQQYDLKRVFYSAYIPVNEDSALPSRETLSLIHI